MDGSAPFQITNARMPGYLSAINNWVVWRYTYGGGPLYKARFLERYNERESMNDFMFRRRITPIPNFVKEVVNEIRNSIFQRMRDIVRKGGSPEYQQAIAGLNGGVDHRGCTMNSYLGLKVLTELLVMGKVGVFVDNQANIGPTLKDVQNVTPYLYTYPLEDILSYTCNKPSQPSEFQAVLLRDIIQEYDFPSGLPINEVVRYRRLWIDPKTAKVRLQFYTASGITIDPDGAPSVAPIELDLERIPFVLLDIGDSLIKDVCDHQMALLNLTSADVTYAIKSNFPFLVKQEDTRAAGAHLKQFDGSGAPVAGTTQDGVRNVGVAASSGLIYPMEANPPGFINPSPDPLRASMELQQKLKNEIRELVNLAVQTVASRASAESKALDNQGLEAGLSYIGLVLENGERLISEYWAAYESVDPAGRQMATVKYPDRYSLKTDDDRISESTKLSGLLNTVPGPTVKREISKAIVQSLLGGKVSTDVLNQINSEIDSAACTTSNPDTIISGVQAGLIDPETAAKAQKAHAERLAAIATAQGVPAGKGSRSNDPAARGIPDASGQLDSGALEKLDATHPDLQADRRPRVRGKGKRMKARLVTDEPDNLPGGGNFFAGREKGTPQNRPFG
jgi:hypothetical protein